MPNFNDGVLKTFFTPAASRSSPHVASVSKFASWFARAHPDTYRKVAQKRPDLLDPVQLMATGALRAKKPQLSGLSEYTDDDYYGESQEAATPMVATAWGADIAGFINQISPAILNARSQSALLNTNISRAEQGLPPLLVNPATGAYTTPMSGTTLLLLAGLFVLANKK